MLPNHCSRCGRLIGRLDARTFEGVTVCLGCFRKLGGDAPAEVTPKQTLTVIILSAIVSALVLGALVWLATWVVEKF